MKAIPMAANAAALLMEKTISMLVQNATLDKGNFIFTI